MRNSIASGIPPTAHNNPGMGRSAAFQFAGHTLGKTRMKNALKAMLLCLIMAPTFAMASSTCTTHNGKHICGGNTLKAAQNACGAGGYKSCDTGINVCVCNRKPLIAPVGSPPGGLKANTLLEPSAMNKVVPPGR